MTEWRKAGESHRPMMARAAAEVQPLAQVVGDIPDEHVITVAERRVSVDYPTIIQNNMNTDTVDLVLDGEWDGMSVVCYIGHPGDLREFEWEGKPFTLPVYDATGSIDVTVVGLSADGKTRLVTVEAKGVMNVIKSGEFEGSVPPEDQPDLLGQILAAKGEAEDAAQSATTAASTANSAASKANSAASSANSAATSANSAATKANSAAVDAQNAYNTLQPYMATIDSCANILHREAGPDSVVTADDSFPCKPVEMTVYGNTVQNLWVNPSGTGAGLTCTSGSDGRVTVSGTSTAKYATLSTDAIYTLRPSTQYTISIDKTVSNGAYFYLNEVATSGNVAHYVGGNGAGNSVTFTTKSDISNAVIRFAVNNTGTTVSGTYRIMLNEGSTAQPWCPPGLNSVGDDGSVMIVTAGKNLADIVGSRLSSAIAMPVKAGQRLVASLTTDQPITDANNQTIYIHDGVTGEYLNAMMHFSATDTGRLQSNVWTCQESNMYKFIMYKGEGGITDIQLERGSTATAYEPPAVTTTPIDLQGHTLNALPDGTRDELHIDGGGNVVLEKRCGVATAPENAGDWAWEIERGSFALPAASRNKGTLDQAKELFCDKLPPAAHIGETNYAVTVIGRGYAYSSAITSVATAATVAGGATYIYPLAKPQTISLGTITPPTMAAPNVTAYVADDTPAEMELDYVRDINIVVDRLEKKVAGTAATVAINEATR